MWSGCVTFDNLARLASCLSLVQTSGNLFLSHHILLKELTKRRTDPEGRAENQGANIQTGTQCVILAKELLGEGLL